METYNTKLMGDVISRFVTDYEQEFPKVDDNLLTSAIDYLAEDEFIKLMRSAYGYKFKHFNLEDFKRSIIYRYKFNMPKKNVIKNLADKSISLYMVDRYIKLGLYGINKFIWDNTDFIDKSDIFEFIRNDEYGVRFRTLRVLFRNGIWTIKDLIALTPSTMKMLDGAGKLTVEEITKFRSYFRPKENE